MLYKNSDIQIIINEYVHSVRDRAILCLRFIDGKTYEGIAEDVDMSPRQIQNIIKRHEKLIFSFT